MNTIDELVYYCNEPNPVGALMLTGEWGCGKTYLIENDLKEALKDTHILVRVSLFGVDSISLLNAAVKKSWVESCSRFLGKLGNKKKVAKAAKQIVGTGGNIASNFIPWIKSATDAALSIDLYDFISIKNVVKVDDNKKKVVLIFDDLERSKLDTIDVLGCINEYCENQHFNTIIVANEEKVKSLQIKEEDKDKPEEDDNNKQISQSYISYDEIKEKIVQRTIRHKPDYSSIIHSLITKRDWFTEEYKQFLIDNEALILGVFETDPVKESNNENDSERNAEGKPHNIRSLICALHEFNRVFCKLIEHELPAKERYLYSFIAYTIADKAGIAEKDKRFGYILSDEAVRKLYPFFDSRFLIESVRRWIKESDWDGKVVDGDLEEIKKSLVANTPKDILRVNRILELDDKTVEEGFHGLLEDCYEGKFNLNEYVLFIENSYWIRQYNIMLPEPINWEKVNEGIKICLNRYVENNEAEPFSNRIIGDDAREHFLEAELKAYDLISDFRENNVAMFKNNKRLYLNSLKENGINTFNIYKNKRFRAFDEEMADATAKCFAECAPYDRAYFADVFYSMWQLLDQSFDTDLEETKQGLEKLSALVEEIKDQYESSSQPIATFQTDRFYNKIQELLIKVNDAIDEKNKDDEPPTDQIAEIEMTNMP